MIIPFHKTKQYFKGLLHAILPHTFFTFLYSMFKGSQYLPPTGSVRFGDLRRLTPLSERYGWDRGLPVDRYYIEKFLAFNKFDIKGDVLEIGDDFYTRKFGEDRVTNVDIFNHKDSSTPNTTIIGDITHAPHITSNTFDCIIFTQTLQLIYEVKSAILTLHRILKPGGVLLTTLSGISQTTGAPWDRYWCWNFTSVSAEKLFKEFFPDSNIEIQGYGNVLVATSFLQGIVTEELTQEELDFHDPNYEILITVRAVKPE